MNVEWEHSSFLMKFDGSNRHRQSQQLTDVHIITYRSHLLTSSPESAGHVCVVVVAGSNGGALRHWSGCCCRT
jgi:hypothetical protein